MNQKIIAIIGMGPGNPDLLTNEAVAALTESDLIIGSRRLKESLPQGCKAPFLSATAPREILEVIAAADQKRICICVSGDSGFYSGTNYLVAPLSARYIVKVVPGISSMSYLSSKCGIPWQDACIVSSHGRSENWLGCVRRHEKTFLLQGQTPREILARLCLCDMGHVTVVMGYMMSYSEEVILKGSARALLEEHSELDQMNSSLCAMFIINPKAADCPYTGIDDEEFVRGRVPMTKSEVRAVALSKLHLKEDDICIDVGAGTGSVTIEMAAQAYRGQVYSVERSNQAINVLKKNIEKFGADNVTVVEGEAASVLKNLPACDAAFIGGSRGQKKRILTELITKNPEVRIVMNIISLESLAETLKLVKEYGLTNLEIVQVTVSKTNLIKDQHLLEGQNPIFVVSCQAALS